MAKKAAFFAPPNGSACRGAILQAVHLSTPCHDELASHAALVICVKDSVKDGVKCSVATTCQTVTAGECCTRRLAGRLRTARVAQ